MNTLRHACSVVLACASIAAAAAPDVTVIATGLVNPRGLAFAPNGQLFVAESGRGGSGNCTLLGDGQSSCYGETGALTRIDPTGQHPPERVIAGLPSLAAPGGFGATGPVAVSFVGTGNGQLAIALGTQADARRGLGRLAHLLGRVLQVNVAGQWMAGADIAAFEASANPVPGGRDSNPYGIAATPSRHLVADAGANALFEAHANGSVRTLSTFPTRPVAAPPFLGLPAGAQIPMQSVPTSVVEGPDGWIYVGELTGFPFPRGGANVYRIAPQGGPAQVFASGFTNITGLAFDARGVLYVLQVGDGLATPGGPPLLPPGKLIRVNGDGSHSVVYAGLFYPGGLAIGPDGAAYVSNFGIVPGAVPPAFPQGGQVLRITLD